MGPIDDLLDSGGAPTDDGIALLAELVAAVAWLRRGAMPGLTVWDAIEQALQRHREQDDDWNDADPLRSALFVTLASSVGQPAADALDHAIRAWLDTTSVMFNQSAPWV